MSKKKESKKTEKKAEDKKPETEKTETSDLSKLNADELTLRYSFFKRQFDEAAEELKNLEIVRADHLTARVTLENLKDLSNENDGLTPIGANTFMISKVADKENVLVDIGSNVVIKKSASDAISRIDSLVEKLNNRAKELANNMQFSQQEVERMLPHIQSLQAPPLQKPSKK